MSSVPILYDTQSPRQLSNPKHFGNGYSWYFRVCCIINNRILSGFEHDAALRFCPHTHTPIKIKCYFSFQLQKFLVSQNHFIATDILYVYFMSLSVVDVNIVILNINKSPRIFIDDSY